LYIALYTIVGIKWVSGLCNSPIQGFFNAEQTLKNLSITDFIFFCLWIFFSHTNLVFAYVLIGFSFEFSFKGFELG